MKYATSCSRNRQFRLFFCQNVPIMSKWHINCHFLLQKLTILAVCWPKRPSCVQMVHKPQFKVSSALLINSSKLLNAMNMLRNPTGKKKTLKKLTMSSKILKNGSFLFFANKAARHFVRLPNASTQQSQFTPTFNVTQLTTGILFLYINVI